MHTPAHLAVSLLVWRREPGRAAAWAVGLGAALPDLPMFGFYGYQKLVAKSTEHAIWSTLYFDPGWQLFFDIFNSIPLMLAVMGLSVWRRWRFGWLLAGSALLHLLFDLPLHHDDAHRHLLPLTHWRFVSPVSYWDPAHFGHVVVWVELAGALAACGWVARRGEHRPMRALAWGTLGLYALALMLVLGWLMSR